MVVDLFNEEWFIRDIKIDAKAEGKEEQAIETAKRMLRRNKLTIAEIAEDTALDISAVEKLALGIQKEK